MDIWWDPQAPYDLDRDGTGGPVASRITEVEGQPATRLGLIYTDHASIASEHIHSTIHEWIEDSNLIPKRKAGHSKELSGDTLTASDVCNFLQDLEQAACPESDSPNSRQSSHSPISSVRQPLETEENAESSLRAHLFPPASGGPPITQNRKPDRVLQSISAERRARWQRDSANRQERALDTPTNPPRKQAMVSPQTSIHRYRPLSRCVSTRSLPSIVPGPRCRFYGPRPLSVPLIERPLMKNGVILGSLQVTADTVGRESLSSIHPCQNLQTSVPLSISSARQRPIRPSGCHPSSLKPSDSWLSRRFCSANWLSVTGSRTQRSATPQSPPSSTHGHEATVGDKLRLAKTMSEHSYFSDPSTCIRGTMPPSTVLSDGRIYVYFPGQIAACIYEIQLDIQIFMSQPDTLGWRSFGLPSLSTDESNHVKGVFEFSIVSQISHDAGLTVAQFDTVGCSVFEDVQEQWLKGSFPVHQESLMRMRLRVEGHHIERWDGTVSTYSSICGNHELGIKVQHNITLTMEKPGKDVFAKRLIFPILIRDGPRSAGLYRVRSGRCTVQLPEYEYGLTDAHDMVEVLIERDYQDMHQPLVLEFTCYYADGEEFSIFLPVILSRHGTVLAERIWLFKPLPPLKLHAVFQSPSSTWELSKRKLGTRELVCFKRMKMVSEGGTDAAVVRVRRLTPVLFNRFPEPDVDVVDSEGACNIIPSLRMVIDVTPGKRLECCLTFDLEIGNHQRLLQVDAAGWQSNYTLINGRLSSRSNADWWYDDMLITLFRDSRSVAGKKLHLDMSFIVNSEFDEFQFTREYGDWVEICHPLPRITDKTVLGGTVHCSHNDTVIGVVRNCSAEADYEELRFSNSCGEDSRRLPMMNRGHKVSLIFWTSHPHKGDRCRPLELPREVGEIRGSPPRTGVIGLETKEPDSSNDADDECDGNDSLGIKLVGKSCKRIRKNIPFSQQSAVGKSPIGLDDHSKHQSPERGLNSSFKQFLDDDDDDDSSGVGDDTPKSLDQQRSDAAPHDAPRNEDRAANQGAGGDAAGMGWEEYLNQLIHLCLRLVRYLEKAAPMQYLIRFLMIELLVFIIMPERYLGGEPARTIQEVVSNVWVDPGAMFLGDVDPGVQPLPNAGLSQFPSIPSEPSFDINHVLEAKSVAPTSGSRGLRDRIDLALGWRPVHE
ncbi:MAG: hypothetical protein Q9219_002177 [cf. Caloplaca sp. 3 TL-2023]